MSKQQDIKTWPERIYLQHGDSPKVPAFNDVYPGNGYLDNVTWCQDRIEPVDVEYVRTDLVAPGAPARITGELLHATYPGFNGGPWEASGNQAVWNDWAADLNARLAGELKQEAKE
jgi:hypothetical protein